MRIVVALLSCAATSCSPPQPRDVPWFEGHGDEAEEVVAACNAGEWSNECENARAALGRLNADARKERYRKGF